MGDHMFTEGEFERILDIYGDRIFSLAMARTGNKKDAEDVFGDTFLKLYKCDIEFESDEQIKEWLIQTAVNCQIGFLRSIKNRQNSKNDKINFENEGDAVIWNEIKNLPQSYSITIHLYYYERYSVEKISSVLNSDRSSRIDQKTGLGIDTDVRNVLSPGNYSWNEFGYGKMADHFHVGNDLKQMIILKANEHRSIFDLQFNKISGRVLAVTLATFIAMVIAISVIGSLINSVHKGTSSTSQQAEGNENTTDATNLNSKLIAEGKQPDVNSNTESIPDTSVKQVSPSSVFVANGSNSDRVASHFDDSQSYWNVNVHNFAKGDNVYYYLDSLNLTKTPYIMRFDPVAGTTDKFCSKAGCSHTTAECNAYLLSNQEQSIWYYKGHLYILKYTEKATVLEQVRIDGSGRRELFEIGEPYNSRTQAIYTIVFGNDCVYIYEKRPNIATGKSSENTARIRCRSLDGKTDKIIYSETGELIYIANARYVAGRLLFMVNHYDLSSKSGSIISMGLYSYDFKTQETSNILNKSILDYEVDIKNNIIYYYIYNDGLYAFNISTQDNTKIFTPANSVKYNSKMSFDEKYIYLIADTNLLVIGTDGTLINTIPIGNYSANINFGDQDYIFANLKTFRDVVVIDMSKLSEYTTNGATMENKNVYIKKSEISTAKEWTILK